MKWMEQRHAPLYMTPSWFAEIPEFLSEHECRVVIQLAQLRGLMESQLMVQDGQEELAKELNLSPEEIFHLLDINQDGQLQLREVHIVLRTAQFRVVSLNVSFNATSKTDTDSLSSQGRHLAHTGESAGGLHWAQS